MATGAVKIVELRDMEFPVKSEMRMVSEAWEQS